MTDVLTDRAKQRREEDTQLIKQTMMWPQWPYLPIKRYTEGKNGPECAFLFDGEATQLVVFRCNLFALKDMTTEERQKIPTVKYDSIVKLLEDDWMVD